MKRIAIALITIIIALFVVCGRPLPAGDNLSENVLYAKSMIITDINKNEIICVDTEGDEWSFFTNCNYNVGATIVCIMNSAGTESIYDDAIVYVTYKGQIIKC